MNIFKASLKLLFAFVVAVLQVASNVFIFLIGLIFDKDEPEEEDSNYPPKLIEDLAPSHPYQIYGDPDEVFHNNQVK
ncbi:hypothetical protein ACVBEJ_00155 [Porticoccus sp. GXU_MW_L64]